MRKAGWELYLVIALCASLSAGCGDRVKQMLSAADTQAQVMESINADSVLAGRMMDKLLSSESGRAFVVDRVLNDGPTAQDVMLRMAKNTTMIDGVLNLAVQDAAMKEHVLTLLKGMQMGGAK
jgi:hypothetical protein